MAFTTGTATSHNDLLDKLRLYLVAQGWTQLAWTAGATVADSSTLQIRGPGAGAGKQVFVNIRTYADTVLSHYCWRMRGATGYTAGLPEGGQPGEQNQPSYLLLWQNAINYWFFVNDRRFIVVAKISTFYNSMYAGFILPWALPAQYPQPIIVAGDFFQPALYNEASSGHRFFIDPGGSGGSSNAWVRTQQGLWLQVRNGSDTSNNDYNLPGSSLRGNNYAFCWPHHAGDDGSTSYLVLGSTTGAAAGGQFDNMVATRQGEYGMFPASIHLALAPPLGALDAVYAVPGAGLVTEQAIATGGRNFRLFQNVNRASANDFMAIEEI